MPADTPIARLDLIPFPAADLTLRGPMPSGYLATGLVRPPSGPRYRYTGQQWDALGVLTLIGIDVYLALVCQVGGNVALASTVHETAN